MIRGSLRERAGGLLPVVRWPLLALLAICLSLPTVQAETEQDEFLKGQLLVASPSMVDPNFAKTVVFMVEHDSLGAMGLVINRPLGEVPLRELLEGLGQKGSETDGDIRIYSGGPVDPKRGFVLHSSDVLLDDSVAVDDDMAVTSEPEILKSIAEGKGPKRAIFVLGYAGWAPGQLEAEIAAGAWESVPADETIVFDEADSEKWDQAIGRHGVEL